MSMTTPETITTRQIRSLRDEALAAGDYAQVDICDVALAAHETADAEGGELRGPDGEVWTRSEARTECARVIADAEAQAVRS